MVSSGWWCWRRPGRRLVCWGKSDRRQQNGRPFPGTPRMSVWNDCSCTTIQTSLHLRRRGDIFRHFDSSPPEHKLWQRILKTHPQFPQCQPRSQRYQSTLWLGLQTAWWLRCTSRTLRCRRTAPGLENRELNKGAAVAAAPSLETFCFNTHGLFHSPLYAMQGLSRSIVLAFRSCRIVSAQEETE